MANRLPKQFIYEDMLDPLALGSSSFTKGTKACRCKNVKCILHHSIEPGCGNAVVSAPGTFTSHYQVPLCRSCKQQIILNDIPLEVSTSKLYVVTVSGV